MEFQGFSPETIDFLWGIRFNNNREWFLEHKKDYQNTLYEPMKALGAALYEAVREAPGMGYRVSRIYKDVRYSTGDPYKEQLWICFRREAESWSQVPTLFFEIRPEDYRYGFVYWRPRAAVTAAFRRELELHPEPVLELVTRAEREAGCPLEGEEYFRKKPCPVPAAERLYNRKSFEAIVTRAPDELLFSPELVQEVSRTLRALLPVNEYFQKLTTKILESEE